MTKMPNRQTEEFAFEHECNQPDHDNDDQHRNRTGEPPYARTGRVAVERAVEFADQTADPGHRVADRANKPLRIADAELDQHGEKRKRD